MDEMWCRMAPVRLANAITERVPSTLAARCALSSTVMS
ncbi:Uncharacterised protein [Mycobacteroides abscessus subsp. abscessus]|nr:Uncharacterised protein [Mycobacteroides abscessus subsp. abscessus]